MKVIGINGSHRAGKSTSLILQSILNKFADLGWQTELVELSNCSIDFCIGCNSCLFGRQCPLHDDFDGILDSITQSDAIILGGPNYFLNVTARMKNFMDRMRPPHLGGNTLSGKVAGVVCTTGLSNAGSDCVINDLRRFCDAQGWITVGGTSVVASWEEGRTEDGRVRYRDSAASDPKAVVASEKMAIAIDGVCKELCKQK